MRESSSPLRHFEPVMVKPNLASTLVPVGAFNRPGLCANSPGNRAYCYAELTVSSPAMAVTIASTHYTYPQRDGQAELAWVAWLNTETATHLSTNLARRRVTSLISPTTLPLSQTAKPNHLQDEPKNIHLPCVRPLC